MENNFEAKAEVTLQNLEEKLFSTFEDLEIILEDGVLKIEAPNGNYVINRHNASASIWFSSPVSRLKYFILKEGEFVEKTENNLTLEMAIMQDLAIKL